MSQEDLAILSGLSKSSINRIEKFEVHPTQLSILKISKAFKLEAQEVFHLDWRTIDV